MPHWPQFLRHAPPSQFNFDLPCGGGVRVGLAGRKWYHSKCPANIHRLYSMWAYHAAFSHNTYRGRRHRPTDVAVGIGRQCAGTFGLKRYISRNAWIEYILSNGIFSVQNVANPPNGMPYGCSIALWSRYRPCNLKSWIRFSGHAPANQDVHHSGIDKLVSTVGNYC